MKLQYLFHDVECIDKLNWDPSRSVKKVTSDSRAVEPGDVFVACPGSRMDGHDFLGQAVHAKAAAIVYESLPDIIVPKSVVGIQVSNSQAALADLLRRSFDYPDRDLQLVGVTGTNGKTTIAYLLHRLLTERQRTAYLGTLWYDLPSRRLNALNTTPGPEILIPLLSDMRKGDVKACVMEVSSHALDQNRVHGLEFELAVFTQLTQDHLDYHKDFEEYFQAKRRLFTGSARPKHVLINRDCPYGRRLLAEIPEARSFSLMQEADYQVVDIQSSFQGSYFTLRKGVREISFQIRLPLRFNIANAVAVLASLDILGHDIEDFRGVLQEIPGIPGRLERIPGDHPCDVFIDYAHTPDAFENVLREAAQIAPSRILTLFGCGGDRDKEKRRLMAEVACRYSDVVMLTTDNPRSEDPEDILKDMKEGIPADRSGAFQILERLDRADAIHELLSHAQPGDVVLILGKGHEDYQILGEKKIPFDDKLVAQQFLQRKSRVSLP